jgi:hypothetical protein
MAKPKVTVSVKRAEDIIRASPSLPYPDPGTKRDISKRGGLSYPYVLHLMESKRNPSIEVLVRYLLGLGLGLYDIRLITLGDILDIMVEYD